MKSLLRCLTVFLLFGLLLSPAARADGARFDLAGPAIDVRVTRAGVELPIADVPNLQPGDKIWLHPDLPPSQSVKYLLIAVFLRGTTNPPPDDWFTRIETWQRKVREEGVTLTVPDEAQQAVLFLAPETGGDFGTLKSAVKGHPGVFIRASQYLTEAGFEQARIERYVEGMKQVPPSDQAALLDHSNLLARTLNLKPNADCFKRPVDQQYNCLTQTGSQTLLDDGHGQSMAATLASGPSSDFINAASTTQIAGGGTYSAYVGALVDMVRLMNGLHTAQYQYIPAIASPVEASLNLKLNTAPSFNNPKSVLVIGMPAIQANKLPPLRPPDPNHISCLRDPKLVLPVEGAPLVFSTAFAHGLHLHLNLPPGTAVAGMQTDLPLAPDAFQGGLMLTQPDTRRELPVPNPDSAPLKPAPATAKAVAPKLPPPTGPITGTVEGMWGFDRFTGPTLPLQAVPGEGWRIVPKPGGPENLIAGQPNQLEIASSGTACVESIEVQPEVASRTTDAAVKTVKKVEWKLVPPPAPQVASNKPTAAPAEAPAPPIELTLNLQHDATPGSLQLEIHQFGEAKPDQLGTRTFSEPAKIQAVQFHAGDSMIEISGAGLGQVKQLTLRNAVFRPVPPAESAHSEPETLALTLAESTQTPAVKAGERIDARVELNDGRTLDLNGVALAARPAIKILSRRTAQGAASPIQLASPDEVPLGAQLVFFVKAQGSFPRNEVIEIANADSSLDTKLSLKDGALLLQDAHTVLATLDPLKTFGPSTFGPFRLRAVAPSSTGGKETDGVAGDWMPLATIVRLPTLTGLRCSADATQPCQLTGSSLFLIDSVATTVGFTSPAVVPEGFVDNTLTIPHPAGPSFYLKLRDDPEAVQTVSLPVQVIPIPGSVKGKPGPAVAPPPVPPPAAAPAAQPATSPVPPTA